MVGSIVTGNTNVTETKNNLIVLLSRLRQKIMFLIMSKRGAELNESEEMKRINGCESEIMRKLLESRVKINCKAFIIMAYNILR